MGRSCVIAASALILLFCGIMISRSQAGKQLDEKAKSVATPQEQSWQQVDKINNEADRTKGRYQQARKSSEQLDHKSGYSVKKSSIGKGSAYKKPSPPKQKARRK